MTEDFDKDIRSILGQLIEAREDQNDADKRLQDYRAANTPPEVPNPLENVDTFLDYHHRRQRYENHLKQHENALKTAKGSIRKLPTSSCFSCPMVCPYVTPTKVNGASCQAQSTSSCASRVKLLSRAPARRLASLRCEIGRSCRILMPK